MPDALTNLVIRYWKLSIGFWLVLTLCTTGILTGWVNDLGIFPTGVPRWNQIAADSESLGLPAGMPSSRGERLFNQAFPKDRLGSSAVVIVYREDSPLTSLDRSFIENELTPRLVAIQAEPGTTIKRVRDFRDRSIGKILDSRTGLATMIVADLQYEFLDQRNSLTVDRIQQVIGPDQGTFSSTIPAGLQIALGGSATVGKDLVSAAEHDAQSLYGWPMLLILCLSFVIFRAPLLALMPVVITAISLYLTLSLLTVLGWAGSSGVDPFAQFRPFAGLLSFVAILVYGAGLNYCIFLIARYRREIERGLTFDHALASALQHAGTTIVASVGTIFCGIGTMLIASFDKYQQVGGGMAISVCITLVCSFTLLPALLKLTGKYAFWTLATKQEDSQFSAVLSANVRNHAQSAPFREGASMVQYRHPFLTWSTVVATLLPFAVYGCVFHDSTTYGVLGDLPPNTPSVAGSLAIERYFGAGQCGPVTVLFRNPNIDYSSPDNYEAIESSITALTDRKEQLGISDIRSLIGPLGLEIEPGLVVRGLARKFYVSPSPEFENHVMRLDLLLQSDAFSQDSRQQLQMIEQTLRDSLPESVRSETELSFIGTTASIVDLKAITDRDRLLLYAGILAVVLTVLMGISRKVVLPSYMILSVAFIYCVTLGLTAAIFGFVDPGFSGIDWKVSIVLFTMLVTIGQDHNVFLISRIKEEANIHGLIGGVRSAMASTKNSLSSCGLITVAALLCFGLSSQLNGSRQLGIALALGILLDTFVARRILLPSWLLMFATKSLRIPVESSVRVSPTVSPLLSGSRSAL
jgi:RND superfamily putative drug exporter